MNDSTAVHPSLVKESAVKPAQTKRRRYTPEYKVAILAEYEALDRTGKGMVLRREGLYTSLLADWRRQRNEGGFAALAAKPGRPPLDPVARNNARLRSRVESLESDLGNARTVIELQAKLLEALTQLPADNLNGGTGKKRPRQLGPRHQRPHSPID